MATISRVASTVWEGTFNQRQFRISTNRGNTEVFYLSDEGHKQAVVGGELKSLMRFYHWYLESKQESSELPVLFVASQAGLSENE